MKNIQAIILAGGKGTRMNSDTPKVLLELVGYPIILWTFDLLKKLNLDKAAIVVTGYKANEVEKRIKQAGFSPVFVRQEKPLGTAHAVASGAKMLAPKTTTVLVLFGDDSALYKENTMRSFLNFHIKEKGVMSILTTKRDDIDYLGGVGKNEKGNVIGILVPDELRQLKFAEKELVCGAFVFDRAWLDENLKLVQANRVNKEYPLPALIKIAADQGLFAKIYPLRNNKEWASVNTPQELVVAEAQKKELLVNGN